MSEDIQEILKDIVKSNAEKVLKSLLTEHAVFEHIETKFNISQGCDVAYFKLNDKYYSVNTILDSWGDYSGYDIDTFTEVIPKTKSVVYFE